MIQKIKDSIQREGLKRTLWRVLSFPLHRWKKYIFFKSVLALPSVQERFTWIYKNAYWCDGETVCGTGSTLRYTERLRKELPNLVKKYGIKSIFDAPCGDFHWMQRVLPHMHVTYTGGDIVLPLIASLNDKYASDRISFVHLNLIKDAFPKADLMICRDCLFHLSYADAKAVLVQFLRAEIPYLLTTSHLPDASYSNIDIQTGDFRKIDLFSAPYHFPSPPLSAIPDWLPPDAPREMYLWSRQQIESAVANWG